MDVVLAAHAALGTVDKIIAEVKQEIDDGKL